MIGFDDVDLAEIVGLTTIRQPLREGGALAADLLLAAIERGAGAAGRGAPGADRRRAAHDVIEAVLSRRGLAVRVGAAGRAGRPRPLPRAVRARRADHLAAVAAGAAGDRARRRCMRWLYVKDGALDERDARGAGEDRARVPRRAAGVVRGGRVAGRRRVRLLRDRRRDRVVPGAAGRERGDGPGRGGARRGGLAGGRAGRRAAGWCATSRVVAGGLVQQGWRDTIDAAADAGRRRVRARRWLQPRAAAGRRRHAGRDPCRAAGARRD